jgi:hypothetical protein
MDQKMNILANKTDAELIRSLLAEIAKTQNEIRCARGDLEKANSRVNFCIAVLNELVNRHED